MTGCCCKNVGLTIYCERHGVHKPPRWVHLCQTNQKYFDAWEAGRGPGQKQDPAKRRAKPKKGLGDRVSQALSLVGITEERVSKWLGRKCGCAKRREALNRLGEWAASVIQGKATAPVDELADILDDDQNVR